MKERRRARRVPILETFALFASSPQVGPVRLGVSDVSELGIGLVVPDPVPSPKTGAQVELSLFLNSALSLPLSAEIVRSTQIEGVGTHLGLQFNDRRAAGYRALSAFLLMLDAITPAARLGRAPKKQRS